MADSRKLRKDAGQARSPEQDKTFRSFEGMNTQARRQAIGPGEFSWIENVMPLGYGNAIIMPGPSSALAAVASGTCYTMQPFNRNGVNFMFMATTTGHAYEVKLDTPNSIKEITTVGSPELSGSGVFIAQWKDERIIIVDPVKGFFDWNGAKLTPSGSVASITILNPGAYTTIPSITFSGGGGSGAAASPNMGINGVQAVAAGGSGFTVGDILTISGGTPNSGDVAQVKVTTIGASNAVTAVAVFNPGSYTSSIPSNPASVTGGTGTGCTLTLSWGVLSATVTNPGTTTYTSAPTVAFSAGAAQATASLIAAPANPSLVAVYQGRVWVIQGRALFWTAPDTYNDFLSTGAGSKALTDPTLLGAVTGLFSANDYLYYTGNTSVNVIADVTVNASGDTVFSDTNLNSSIGTNNAGTITPFLRQTLFVNTSGVYSQLGSMPVKISGPMDGVFNNVDFHGLITGAYGILNRVVCACFLVLYNTSGQPSTAANSRPLFLIYFDQKWFVANQDSLGRAIVISSGFASDPNPNSNIYATDGTSIFKLFADPTNLVSWMVQTAYWDMEQLVGSKEGLAFGVELDETFGGTVNVALDMVQKEAPYKQSNNYTIALDADISWINNFEVIVTWTGSGGAEVDWETPSYTMNLQDGSAFGKYVGMTLTSNTVTGVITSLALGYMFRERW